MSETGVSASGGAAAYAERMKRIMDAVELGPSDRVPVAFFNMFWLARYGGISYREAMYNYERLAEIARRAFLKLQPDIYAYPHLLTAVGPVMEKMGYKQLQWPGHSTGTVRFLRRLPARLHRHYARHVPPQGQAAGCDRARRRFYHPADHRNVQGEHEQNRETSINPNSSPILSTLAS
jgi:hypothetical protein